MKTRFIFFSFLTILIASFCILTHVKAGKLIFRNNDFDRSGSVFVDKAIRNFPDIDKALFTDFQLVSHGRPGELLIEGEWKNAVQIAAFLNSKFSIQRSAFKNLHIYGCEFGKGEKGKAAVAYLQKALGMSVSASDDITGKGGDWDLEVGNFVSIKGLEHYDGTLQYAAGDDYDGDGVMNAADIDDDNDGVPDAVESPSCFYTINEWNTMAKPATNGVTITSALTATTGNFAQLLDSVANVTAVTFSGAPAQPIQNQTVYLFTFTQQVKLDALYLKFNTNTQFSGTTVLQGSNNGTTWDTLTAPISHTAMSNTTANGNLSLTTSIKYPVTLHSNATYRYYRITGYSPSNIVSTGAASEVYFDFNNAAYVASRYPKASCNDANIDGDGILPQFDLDSDGDGCSDAYESGATTNTTANYQFTYTDSNGDGLVTAADPDGDGKVNYTLYYNPYALKSFLKACMDTDGDAVKDMADIDDDNDGVLDATEGISCQSLVDINLDGRNLSPYTDYNTETGPGCWGSACETINYFNLGSSASACSSAGTATNLPAGYNNNSLALATNFECTTTDKAIVKFSNVSVIQGQLYAFKVPFLYIGQNTPATTLYINGVAIQTITLCSVTGQWQTFNFLFTPTTSTITIELKAAAVSVTGNTTDGIFLLPALEDANSGIQCQMSFIDTDNDGIPNHLDLDSDGDGCPDTKEAILFNNSNVVTQPGLVKNGSNGAVTSAMTLANATVPGPYSGNGFADTLQAIADTNSYKYVYTYMFLATSATNNTCLDSDADGIPDFASDLDADDDGIPNALESPSCFFTEAQAVNITEGVTSGFTWTAANPLSSTYDDSTTTFGRITPSVDILNRALITFDLPVINKAVLDTVKLMTGNNAFGTGTWRLEGLNSSNTWDTLSASQDMNATNSTFNFINTYHAATAYHSYRIIGSTSTPIANNAALTEFSIHYKNYNASRYPVKTGCLSDTDNDGVSNFFDRDSDGDGCPDAVEAGVSGTLIAGGMFNAGTGNVVTANAVAQGPYGTNGLADGVETIAGSGIVNYASTYNLYALSATINACLDSDGDGIKDIADIDDDNDGIVDITEESCTLSNTAKTGITVTKPSTINYSFNGIKTLANMVDGLDGTNYVMQLQQPPGTLSNAEWFRVEFASSKILTQWEVGHYPGQYLFSVSSTYKVQGSPDGSSWADLTDTLTYSNNQTGQSSNAYSNIANFPQNVTAFKYYRYFGITGAAGVGNASEFFFKEKNCTDTDTDGDGIANRLDLDSDGDGCPDLKEAAVSPATDISTPPSATNNNGNSYGIASTALTGSQLNPAATDNNNDGLNDSVDPDVNSVTNYTSTYAPYALSNNWSLCADTDGDGIPDLTDIDDDNDGILDAVESPSCFYTATEIKPAATVTSDFTYSASPNALSAIYDNSTVTYGQVPTATNILAKALYTLILPVANAQRITSITDSVGAIAFGNGTWMLEGSNNGTTWDTLSAAQAMNTASTKYTFSNTLKPNNAYSRYRLVGATNNSTLANARLQEININYTNYSASYNPKPTCATDADNDGIPNHRDLDSDGDKCPDAYEAGTYNKAGVTTGNGNVQNGSSGAVTSTVSTSNAIINGPYSGNGFADVLQIVSPGDTNAYQYTYTYNIATDSTQKACCIASNTAPVLTKTSDSVCGNSTYNLNSILSDSGPAYNVVAWFTDNAHVNAYGTPAAAIAGTYYAFYKDTINNCFSPASTGITIVSKALPIGSASPQTICSGKTTAVALNATISGATYTWTAALQSGSVSGFSNCASGCASTIAQTLTGAGVVRYTVTPSANGCAGNAFTVDVTVSAVPNATIAYSGSPYLSGSGTANVTQTGQTGGTYSATPSGLSINAATGQVNINSSFANTYTVKYIFSNGTCTDSTTATLTINATNDTVTTTPACPTCPVTVCAVVDDVDTTGGATYSTPCGTPAGYTAGTVGSSGCITYTPTGSVTDTSTACIVTCNNGKCDTTRVILYPPVPTADTVTATPTCPTCPVVVCPVFDDVSSSATLTVTSCGAPAGYTITGPNPTTHCYTFTPNGTVTNTASTCIVVCDGNRCDTTRVIIYPPAQTINHDWNVGFSNMPVAGNISSNDQVYTNSTYGNVQANANNPTAQVPVLNSNGTYAFTASQPGNYTFTISVCAPAQTIGCPTQLLTINISDTMSNTNALPIANPDMVTTPYQTTVGIPTLDNDASGNYGGSLNPASVTITHMPNHGTIDSIGINGDIYYHPNAGFTGTDTLTYRVCDQLLTGNCDTAYQIITVLPPGAANTAAASDDYSVTLANTPVSGNTLSNDIDPEGNSMLVTPATTNDANGTFTINDAGNYTFTPASNFVGSAHYTYQVCDNGTPSACATATVYFLVYPENTTPLPVKVISFTGKSQDNHTNLLNWQVTDVKGMDNYEIRKSTDQKNWNTLGSITADNKDGIQNMQLIDNNPDAVDYYRLVLKDKNGQVSIYPKVVYIRESGKVNESVNIYPNPAETILNLEYNSNLSDVDIRVEILDITGRKINQVVHRLSAGKNTFPISLNGLADGSYVIRYYNLGNGSDGNLKFIKTTK